MSIFGNIMSSIFGHAKAASAQSSSTAPGKPSGPSTTTPSAAKTAAAPVGAKTQSMLLPFSPNWLARKRRSLIGDIRL
jgi:hypothetical protein